MRIGIDFDNTIAGYDQVFLSAAARLGLVASDFQGGKKLLRDELRSRPDGEIMWQKLQGQVYGSEMASAVLVDGVDTFLRRCRAAGHVVCIVSHKTEYGHYDPAQVNLRQAALDWMAAFGFFRDDGYGIFRGNVFFEPTREAKIRRIADLDCAYFIDDLVEVLSDAAFPQGVRPILFAEQANGIAAIHCRTWRQITEAIFGECS